MSSHWLGDILKGRTVLLTTIVVLLLVTLTIGVVTDQKKVPESREWCIGSRNVLLVGQGQTYTSIQDAVDNASSGDTVRVYAGTYHELLLINKTLDLVGNGSADTIVDGDLQGSVVTVTNESCNISGFQITGSGSAPGRVGILLESGNNTVTECNSTDNYIGIKVSWAFGNSIVNTTCFQNTEGLWSYHSPNGTIWNVSCDRNHEYGIHSEESDNVRIENCSADHNDVFGVFINNCFDNILLNNTMEGCGLGLFGGKSYNCYDSHIIDIDNTVNGRPIYYWENRNVGTIPTDAGQVIIVYSQNVEVKDLVLDNCSLGVKLYQSDYINITNVTCKAGIRGIEITGWGNRIEDCIITGSNRSGIFINGLDNVVLDTLVSHCDNTGIYLDWSSDTVIRNCTLDSVVKDEFGFGLHLSSSSGTVVDGCTFSNNLYGITMWRSNNNLITGCTGIYNNISAIFLSINSNNNIFRDCDLSSNENNGMMIGDRYINNSNNNVLENCNMSMNVMSGLAIRDSIGNVARNCTFSANKHGVSIADARDNTIKNCTIDRNTVNGVYLYYKAHHTLVTKNHILDNQIYGVRIEPGNHNNSILYNSFYYNNNGNKQAFDIGENNLFNSSDKGNYWSDWTTPDIDKDGIVDDPYKIDGIVQSRDYFPIAFPFGTFKVLTKDVNKTWEDELYSVNYSVFAIDVIGIDTQWSFSTNASWLNFSQEQVLSGTPTNDDVGSYWVNVTVESPLGMEVRNFSLEVCNVNDPPEIVDISVKMMINQTEPYYADFNAIDIDPTGDKLVWDVDTEAPFLTINDTTGVLNGTPGSSDVGIYNVSVYVTDTHGGYDWFNFTLSVIDVNEPPQAEDLVIFLNEDQTDHKVEIASFVSDPDGDDLMLFFNKMDHMKINILDDHIEVVPDPDWNGQENVSVIADDGQESITFVITVNVLPINDGPSSITIVGVENNTKVDNGTALNLTALVEDVDLLYEGDLFTFTWTSSISGLVGTTQNLPALILEPGIHTITVRATDKGTAWIETSVVVEVEEDEGPPEDDDVDDDDDDDDELPLLFYLLPALIVGIIAVIVIIALVVILKKRSKAEDKPAGRKLKPGETMEWEMDDEEEVEVEEEEDEKEVEVDDDESDDSSGPQSPASQSDAGRNSKTSGFAVDSGLEEEGLVEEEVEKEDEKEIEIEE